MSWEPVAADGEKTYPNHSQEDTGGTKGGLGWWETTRLFCERQGLYEQIQGRENTIAPFRSWGF